MANSDIGKFDNDQHVLGSMMMMVAHAIQAGTIGQRIGLRTGGYIDKIDQYSSGYWYRVRVDGETTDGPKDGRRIVVEVAWGGGVFAYEIGYDGYVYMIEGGCDGAFCRYTYYIYRNLIAQRGQWREDQDGDDTLYTQYDGNEEWSLWI